ncbi:MAG TPA: sodium:proton antiporter [Thermomicrobiales bacterium]|nr:sodium:proton antiporter [Thermomicrobiales bacterium]
MDTAAALAIIIGVGIGAQWLAWRLRLPSILLLLLAGIALGPGLRVLDPDRLLGPLVFPFVSLAVALILFEGGLNLDFKEIASVRQVVVRLVTLGALATWAVCGLAAALLLGFSPGLAVLMGAVLIVTGPTVVLPLLRHVQPTARVRAVLEWEGIVIDPIGAIVALLVADALAARRATPGPLPIALGVAETIVAGAVPGLLAAGLLVLILRRYWAPETLDSPLTVALVLGAFTVANLLQPEGGLVAVTVMGIALANQRWAVVRPIAEFKENLRVLLLACLFIVLAARLTPGDLTQPGLAGLLFLAAVMFVARPACVLISTVRSELRWGERLFMCWIAPRGVVAASVSSLFALQLARAGVPGAERLVPATFLVIIGTVLIYGLTATSVARLLREKLPPAQGLLVLGAHRGARAVAAAVKAAGIPVLLVDTNAEQIAAARAEGLRCYHGNILAEHVPEHLPLDGIGRLIALTRNDEVNALAAVRFREVFGRTEVYQLAPHDVPGVAGEAVSTHLRGRVLFAAPLTFAELDRRLATGARVEALPPDGATPEPDGAAPPVPLFAVRGEELTVLTPEPSSRPRPRQTVIALVGGEAVAPSAAPAAAARR